MPEFKMTKDDLREGDLIRYKGGETQYRVTPEGKGADLVLKLYRRVRDGYELDAYDRCQDRSLDGCEVWRRGPLHKMVKVHG